MIGNRHRGFTLIELMVVIGVILLLMGIAVFSYQKLDQLARNNDTRMRLQICVSIESAFEAISPTNMIEGTQTIMNPFPTRGTILIPDTAVYEAAGQSQQNNSPLLIVPPPDPPTLTYLYIPTNPGNVNPGSGSRYSTPYLQQVPILGTIYFQNRTVLNTSVILQFYSRIPAIQSTLAKLPTTALLPANPDMTFYTDPTLGVILPSMAPPSVTGGIGTLVIVDAWKNPIIYVPAAGMDRVVLGTKVASLTQTGVPGQAFVVRSIDGRPFWASAGPDGNFQTGDDNLYSCPVVYSAN